MAVDRRAIVLINGLQLLECVLPTQSEKICFVQVAAHENLRVMHDHGRVELSCFFFASSAVDDERRPWQGTLTADDEIIQLGQLPQPGVGTRVICRYVKQHPRTLRLTITFLDSPNATCPHPEAGELLTIVRMVLLHDDLNQTEGGFVGLSKLKDKLEHLEVYRRVVGNDKDNRNFHAFVVAHSEVLQLRPVAGQEAQVALQPSAGKPLWPAADVAARQTRDARRERAIVEGIHGIVREEDLPYPEVLAQVGTLPEFRSALRASTQTFTAFLRHNDEHFWIKNDPVHTTRVGRRDTLDARLEDD